MYLTTRGRVFTLLRTRTCSPSFLGNTRKSPIFMAARYLTNTVDIKTAVDWDDRIALQKLWSNREKGWKVDVEWKMTPVGVGLFAAQDIAAGTILRTGIFGCNLKQLSSIDDIENFCQNGSDDEYDARLRYVADYLWGYCDAHHQDERNQLLSVRHVGPRQWAQPFSSTKYFLSYNVGRNRSSGAHGCNVRRRAIRRLSATRPSTAMATRVCSRKATDSQLRGMQ